MKTVTASEANRNFSALMREVAAGETILVTSHGRPVARMVPVAANAAQETAEEWQRRRDAAADLIAFMRQQPRRPDVSWTRQELYDDDANSEQPA